LQFRESWGLWPETGLEDISLSDSPTTSTRAWQPGTLPQTDPLLGRWAFDPRPVPAQIVTGVTKSAPSGSPEQLQLPCFQLQNVGKCLLLGHALTVGLNLSYPLSGLGYVRAVGGQNPLPLLWSCCPQFPLKLVVFGCASAVPQKDLIDDFLLFFFLHIVSFAVMTAFTIVRTGRDGSAPLSRDRCECGPHQGHPACFPAVWDNYAAAGIFWTSTARRPSIRNVT
jgi:hypothetical protein